MDPTIKTKTLLLVAGPSGCGKTVLINQYRGGTLAREIVDLLPADGERWPQIGANDCMKRGVRLDRILPRTWTEPGGVVHYDTAYVHRFGQPPAFLARYEDDPGTELFGLVARICAVSISPSADVLDRQFTQRLTRHRESKAASHLFWRDYVRGPGEQLIGRLKGVNARDTAALYRDPDWLARCYAAWASFVTVLIASKPGSRHVVLEPTGGGSGAEFRVVSAD